MGSKIVNLEIFLIYFLLLIPWPHTHVLKRLCSKDNSRLVRKIVRSKWTPILDKYQAKLPLECPLHPFRDIFAPRQDAKKRDRPTQWTCRLCGKSFYQEKFLDLHFETRHKEIINDAEDAVCLADFCDIMRCDVFQTEESQSLKIGEQNIVTDIEVWGDSFGQNSALAKANVAYLSLLPIRTSSTSASKADKVQNRQLCKDKIGQTKCHQQTDSDSNENYIVYNGASTHNKFPNTVQASETYTTSSAAPQKPYTSSSTASTASTGGASSSSSSSSSSRSSTSHSTSASASATATTSTSSNIKSSTTNEAHHPHKESGSDRGQQTSSDDSGNTKGTTAEQNSDNLHENNASEDHNKSDSQVNNMQKVRANCKTEELSKLKAKCEYLVRSCIGGLILTMTEQNFIEMEEEMNKAVCWYLTCERYWEDGPLEQRAFPWGLLLILVFVLSTGISFCYYIIWILFDSEETTINANNISNVNFNSNNINNINHQHMYIPAHPHYHHHMAQQQQQQQQQEEQHHQHYLQEDPYIEDHMLHYQEYHPTTGMIQHGMSNSGGVHPTSTQYYYQQQLQQQQQQQQQQANTVDQQVHHDMYPEPLQYDNYRRSPRRYIGDQRQPATPTMSGGNVAAHAGAQTPLRHPAKQTSQQSHAYTQDILDRRDYISSRPLATTVVSNYGPITHGSTGALSHHSAQMDCDNTLPATHLGATSTLGGSGSSVAGGSKHYNTIPRPLESRQRYVSGSQQSLRGSSSQHEIIQNEVGHNEHYIYVTYPPDLKKRFFEKYE